MILGRLKDFIVGFAEDLADQYGGSTLLRVLLAAICVFLLLTSLLGIYWNSEPNRFDIVKVTAQTAQRYQQPVVVGSSTTATLMAVAEVMLEKPGGFLTNDIMPPGVWSDNIPNWEYGVLVQIRDLSRAMREVFSRSQSQSKEDSDLSLAEPRFNFDNDSWALPASEAEYRDGVQFLQGYFQRLADADQSNAQFYARADNLRYWLATVESRLGSLSQRLSASVGQRRLNTDLAGDSAAKQSTGVSTELLVKTDWFEIDDVFFEARGASWALVHFLKAVEIDFSDVLEKKNASVSLGQIIRELEATQGSVFSPMILNGDGFGFVANHSLVMASYISRANAAIIDLRVLLSQG